MGWGFPQVKLNSWNPENEEQWTVSLWIKKNLVWKCDFWIKAKWCLRLRLLVAHKLIPLASKWRTDIFRLKETPSLTVTCSSVSQTLRVASVFGSFGLCLSARSNLCMTRTPISIHSRTGGLPAEQTTRRSCIPCQPSPVFLAELYAFPTLSWPKSAEVATSCSTRRSCWPSPWSSPPPQWTALTLHSMSSLSLHGWVELEEERLHRRWVTCPFSTRKHAKDMP